MEISISSTFRFRNQQLTRWKANKTTTCNNRKNKSRARENSKTSTNTSNNGRQAAAKKNGSIKSLNKAPPATDRESVKADLVSKLTPTQSQPKEILKQFKLTDLVVDTIKFELSTHDPVQVSSYSVNFSGADPSMLVPAKPGIYTKPQVPFSLSATLTRSANPDYSHKFFQYPFEAMLIALHESINNFNINNYDLITDRSGLRQLFEWATGVNRVLQIDFEKYENCLLMRRADFRFNPNKGVATSFENHCTNNFESTSDYFISEFKFGERKVLMRYEVDCVLGNDLTMIKHIGSNVPYQVWSVPQPPFKVVELKAHFKEPFLPPKILAREHQSTWFQSYITGVKDIVVGMKEQIKGETRVTEIIHKSINDYVIDKDIAQLGMRRVIALLDLIHKSMANEQYGSRVSLVARKASRACCR